MSKKLLIAALKGGSTDNVRFPLLLCMYAPLIVCMQISVIIVIL